MIERFQQIYSVGVALQEYGLTVTGLTRDIPVIGNAWLGVACTSKELSGQLGQKIWAFTDNAKQIRESDHPRAVDIASWLETCKSAGATWACGQFVKSKLMTVGFGKALFTARGKKLTGEDVADMMLGYIGKEPVKGLTHKVLHTGLLRGHQVTIMQSARSERHCDVQFQTRPPKEVTRLLSERGFRWDRYNAVWYGLTEILPAEIAVPATPAKVA